MHDFTDSPLVRTDKTLAHDYGLKEGATQFGGVEKTPVAEGPQR